MKNNSVDIASLILQILNLQILFQDFNNTDLMEEIQKIIIQNEKIIELLEKGGQDGRKNN